MCVNVCYNGYHTSRHGCGPLSLRDQYLTAHLNFEILSFLFSLFEHHLCRGEKCYYLKNGIADPDFVPTFSLEEPYLMSTTEK